MTDVAPAPLEQPDEAVSEYAIPDGLMAMTNDDGTVITILKRDPESGAVIRHDGDWMPLVDPSTLDGLNFVGVVDGAVELYDENESAGSLLPIAAYPPSEEGPFWTEISSDDDLVLDEETGEYSRAGESDEELVEEPEEEEEEALAASVTLDTAEDLDAAIAAAAADPELQWYVERRVASLGLEAHLPWLEV